MSGRTVRNVVAAILIATLWIPSLVAAVDAPVADAAMRGDAETVRALLQQGVDANAAQGDGMTGLHWAAEGGHAAVADLLLAAGAGVEAKTRVGGYTPPHLASRGGHGASRARGRPATSPCRRVRRRPRRSGDSRARRRSGAGT